MTVSKFIPPALKDHKEVLLICQLGLDWDGRKKRVRKQTLYEKMNLIKIYADLAFVFPRGFHAQPIYLFRSITFGLIRCHDIQIRALIGMLNEAEILIETIILGPEIKPLDSVPKAVLEYLDNRNWCKKKLKKMRLTFPERDSRSHLMPEEQPLPLEGVIAFHSFDTSCNNNNISFMPNSQDPEQEQLQRSGRKRSSTRAKPMVDEQPEQMDVDVVKPGQEKPPLELSFGEQDLSILRDQSRDGPAELRLSFEERPASMRTVNEMQSEKSADPSPAAGVQKRKREPTPRGLPAPPQNKKLALSVEDIKTNFVNYEDLHTNTMDIGYDLQRATLQEAVGSIRFPEFSAMTIFNNLRPLIKAVCPDAFIQDPIIPTNNDPDREEQPMQLLSPQPHDRMPSSSPQQTLQQLQASPEQRFHQELQASPDQRSQELQASPEQRSQELSECLQHGYWREKILESRCKNFCDLLQDDLGNKVSRRAAAVAFSCLMDMTASGRIRANQDQMWQPIRLSRFNHPRSI